MPSALETAALRWRARLLAQERAPMLQLQRVYEDAWRRLEAEIAGYTERIQSGDEAWQGLLERRRLAEGLQRTIEGEIRRLMATTEAETVSLQEQAVGSAYTSVQEMVWVQDAQIAMALRQPSFLAVEALVGFAGDGSPLRDVLADASAGRAEQMVNLLAQNVTLGVNPVATARQMHDQFAVTLSRARTIARSETLRAYREASLMTMQANNDVLDGWIRIEACDDRTCAACWALHGRVYRLRDAAREHPNGRMVLAPHVIGAPVAVTPGPERFAELSAARQLSILGPARFEAFRERRVSLSDMVGYHHSPRWGMSIGVRSLRDLAIPIDNGS